MAKEGSQGGISQARGDAFQTRDPQLPSEDSNQGPPPPLSVSLTLSAAGPSFGGRGPAGRSSLKTAAVKAPVHYCHTHPPHPPLLLRFVTCFVRSLLTSLYLHGQAAAGELGPRGCEASILSPATSRAKHGEGGPRSLWTGTLNPASPSVRVAEQPARRRSRQRGVRTTAAAVAAAAAVATETKRVSFRGSFCAERASEFDFKALSVILADTCFSNAKETDFFVLFVFSFNEVGGSEAVG